MKIYPSNHKIKTITSSHIDTDLNIPLSYVNVDYSKYKITKDVNSNFKNEKKNPLIINDEFDNIDIKVFNDNEEEVDTSNLFINKDGKYVYYPNDLITFIPKFFKWNATIKKKLEYKISNTYNISINFYDDSINNKLNSAFVNPAERSLLPPNIKINSNKMYFNTFNEISSSKADFTFISNTHAAYYDDECKNKINIYDYLKTNTNLWISTDDARSINDTYNILISSNSIEYKLSNPIIHSDSKIYCNTYFDLTSLQYIQGVVCHNIFNKDLIAPILILEYVNSGFVIISHSSILDNIEYTYGLVFETLMYVYLNSYLSTDNIREWITYDVPKYEIVNNKLQTKENFISNTDLSNYFNIDDSSMELVNINILDDDTKYAISNSDLNDTLSAIKCIGKINNKLVFELDKNIPIDGYVEYEKPIGWISIYYKERIYYLNSIHYLIENDLNEKIYLIENNSNLLVKIYPFKNSLLGINLKSDTTLLIPFIKSDSSNGKIAKQASYTIYIKNNIIEYCYNEDYKDENNQYKLFTISISSSDNAIKLYDIRQLGGGLPEDEQDNFNLFDIGHINGRPYRPNGTLIITMPTKYKKYEDLILKTLQKYMVGEDYPIIFFEDKEENNE